MIKSFWKSVNIFNEFYFKAEIFDTHFITKKVYFLLPYSF